MTNDELKKQLDDVLLPLIRETVGTELKDLVEAQVHKAMVPLAEQQTDWFGRILRGAQEAQTPKVVREKGLAFGRITRAMALGKREGGGYDTAAKYLKAWGDGDLADEVMNVQTKALAASTPTAGGFLVPEQYSTDIIELRRARTVMRGLGPRILPMPTGTVNVPKTTGGATGTYIGENTNITKSQQTFGQIQLTWKKLAVLTPFSNDLLRYSSPAADAVVRDDIVRSLSVTEDAAFIRGDGMAGSPKGLRNWCPAANLVLAGTTSLAQVTTDLGLALLALKNNNVPMTKVAWILAPRSEHYLLTIQTTTGQFAYRDEMLTRRTIWGYPYAVTTSVPINISVAGHTDSSEVYCVDLDDCVIGDSQRLIIDVSSEAAYHDGSSVVAAFSQDQTVVRAIAEHDFAMRDSNAVGVIYDVRWGV